MRSSRAGLATMFLAVLVVVPSFAHHNVEAVFDTAKPVTIKGTITSVDWRNPHSSIYVNVRDDSGKVTSWWIEIASIATLTKAGLDKSIIDLNQTYSIEAFQAKSGSAQAVGLRLTFPDSRSFDVSWPEMIRSR